MRISQVGHFSSASRDRPASPPSLTHTGIRARAVLMAAAVVALLPMGLQGQEAASEGGDDAVLRSVAADLEPGDRLRVETSDGERLEGRLARRAERALHLRLEEGREATVAFSSLDRLFTRKHATKKGAIIGGATGAVVGGIAGATLAEFACAETSESCGVEGGFAGAGIVGAATAGVGAGIGRLVSGWERRYPR